jgi:hypothetical protein
MAAISSNLKSQMDSGLGWFGGGGPSQADPRTAGGLVSGHKPQTPEPAGLAAAGRWPIAGAAFISRFAQGAGLGRGWRRPRGALAK